MPDLDLDLDFGSWGFGDWLTLGLLSPDAAPQHVSRRTARVGCLFLFVAVLLAVGAFLLHSYVHDAGHEKVVAKVLDTYKHDSSTVLVECSIDGDSPPRIFRTRADAVPLVGVTYRFVVVGNVMWPFREHKGILDVDLVELNGVQPPADEGGGFLGININLFGTVDPKSGVPMAKGSQARNARDGSANVLLAYLMSIGVLLLAVLAISALPARS